MTNREAWIALSLISGIGPRRARSLVETLGSPQAILNAPPSALRAVPGIGAELADAIGGWRLGRSPSSILEEAHKRGDRILTLSDQDFPPELGTIHDPPMTLFLRGRPPSTTLPTVAIVGARRPTGYGLDNARRFARALASKGIPIISGGARGIDTAAHLGALDADGATVAVLGNGLDIFYPKENRHLFERIALEGALVSEFPYGRHGDRHTFPARNRIIAGLSAITLVVEADRDSGALITADLAADYGRTVLAIPGPISNPKSRGCHDLIRNGAGLCDSPDRVIEELEALPGPSPLRPIEHPSPQAVAKPAIDDQGILAVITHEPMPIEEVIRASDLPVSQIQSLLMQLEIQGLGEQPIGKAQA